MEKRPRGRPRTIPPGPTRAKTWNIPRGVATELTRRAKKNGTSVNALVIAILMVHLKMKGGDANGNVLAR